MHAGVVPPPKGLEVLGRLVRRHDRRHPLRQLLIELLRLVEKLLRGVEVSVALTAERRVLAGDELQDRKLVAYGLASGHHQVGQVAPSRGGLDVEPFGPQIAGAFAAWARARFPVRPRECEGQRRRNILRLDRPIQELVRHRRGFPQRVLPVASLLEVHRSFAPKTVQNRWRELLRKCFFASTASRLARGDRPRPQILGGAAAAGHKNKPEQNKTETNDMMELQQHRMAGGELRGAPFFMSFERRSEEALSSRTSRYSSPTRAAST